jgi:hypothetical protein
VSLFFTTTHNDGQLMWKLFVKIKGTCDHIHVQTYLYFWFFAQDHLAWCLSTVLFHRMILYLQMVKCKRLLLISQRPHTPHYWGCIIMIHLYISLVYQIQYPLVIHLHCICRMNMLQIWFFIKLWKWTYSMLHLTEGMAFEDVHVFMNHQKVHETHINLQNSDQISQF